MNHPTPDLLAAIVASTRCALGHRRASAPLAALERRAAVAMPRGALFVEAISDPGRLNVIAECKRRSPSRGILRADYDPASIAEAYQAAGAAALSVLTEPTFFDGTLDHLASVRERVRLPLLRKDFIVDEYQLIEARAAGADAVLLIVAALDAAGVRRLAARAAGVGLAVLVEVHDAAELAVALDAGVRLVGVNNRSLRTLAVDTRASLDLAAAIPDDVVAVAESGLRSHEDLCRMRDAGYDAFLVGEQLMGAERPGDALAGLLAEGGRR
jgi:indole-3-glycerol phosphate synthase